jgi:hypothetical protein
MKKKRLRCWRSNTHQRDPYQLDTTDLSINNWIIRPYFELKGVFTQIIKKICQPTIGE